MCNANRGCVDMRSLGVGNILSSLISSQNRLNRKRMHNIPLLQGSMPQYNRSSHPKNSHMALQSIALLSPLSQLPSFRVRTCVRTPTHSHHSSPPAQQKMLRSDSPPPWKSSHYWTQFNLSTLQCLSFNFISPPNLMVKNRSE